MPKFPGFIGPSNLLRSPIADAERTINLYPEATAPGSGKSPMVLYKRPAYLPFLGLGNGPVRQLFELNGQAFAVSGGTFYEFFDTQTAIARGTVVVDGNPATIDSNGTAGNQIMIVSGGFGYIYNLTTHAFTQITSPNFLLPCSMAYFIDSVFMALHAGSRQFQVSAQEDGLTWDGLDVAEVSTSADNLQALVVDHREAWFLGLKMSQVWNNTGESQPPYSPIPGAYLEEGLVSPWCAAKADNTIFWVNKNANGNALVYRAQGYSPKVVSSPAVSLALQEATDLDRSIMWSYQQQGHAFVLISVPSLETTRVYDASTQLWHERGHWDTVSAVYTPDRGRCHCFAFGKHLVGDRLTGTVYELSLDADEDQLVVP